MRAKKVNEGTWDLPKTKEKRIQQGLPFIMQLEKMKKELYPIFGDDDLFDHLDGAEKRLQELIELEDSKIK